jgi:signal transduction histidine kinase
VEERTAELVGANAALTREIAERQAAEAELQEAQAEVARTLRLATVAETAAAIAHEINQPLAAISANASACLRSLARDPPLLDLSREAAGCIVADANRAADVVGRVRALLNKEGPRHAPVEVNGIIQDVLALSRSAADRQAVTIDTDLAEPLPPVLGDPVQLQQVLLNLVTNAIEAMAATAARPRVLAIQSRLDEAGAVVVTVEDSGSGIPREELPKIFEKFYQVGNPDQPRQAGSGLGLAIAREIVEAHGGTISAESEVGKGTTFRVTLPDRPPAPHAAEPHATPVRR